MAIPKIVGTETEYGITTRNAADQDPVSVSTLVVNSYKDHADKSIVWDYDQENPLMDARGFRSEGEEIPPPDKENNSVINDILVNGGRYYVDHAHPEYCTPECATARELVQYEKAGELILDISRITAEQSLPPEQEILIYKNNSDRKGHSYGYHENYLMDRKLPFQHIVDGLTPFLVTRQIFCGSGKLGAENGTEATHYQISQRADFFETEVGLSTMVDRPIINTRDEPHADEKLYRRLHVIVGDANMAEPTIYLKIGSTAAVLALIEDGHVRDQFRLQEPVRALKQVSRDLSCKRPLRLENGKQWTPIQIQWEYLALAEKHLEADEETKQVLHYWAEVLSRLEKDPMLLDREIDWVIKYRLLEAYRARHQLAWDDHRMRMLDLQYHDIRPNKGLYYRLVKKGNVKRIVTQDEIVHAVSNPPPSTRAYFRGMCLKKYAAQIHGASWNSLIFDVGESAMDKIFLNHPTRGTQDSIAGELVRLCATAAELVNAFQRANASTTNSSVSDASASNTSSSATSSADSKASAEAPKSTGEEG